MIWRKSMTEEAGKTEKVASGTPSEEKTDDKPKGVPESKKDKADEPFPGRYFMLAVMGGWGIEFVYAYAAEPDLWTALRTFSLLWFASGAAFFGGTIAGFLFGVPKSLSVPGIATSEGVSRYKPNTNLEEVSDWLTKIISRIRVGECG